MEKLEYDVQCETCKEKTKQRLISSSYFQSKFECKKCGSTNKVTSETIFLGIQYFDKQGKTTFVKPNKIVKREMEDFLNTGFCTLGYSWSACSFHGDFIGGCLECNHFSKNN